VAISPQREENSRKLAQSHKLSFDLLSDSGNQVARQFKLVFTLPDYLRPVYRDLDADLEKFNGDASWTLPLSARYLIDRDSTIRSADVNADYTVRPDPSKTLEALRALKKS
jgi:peroxiredoxin